ncbi:MAG: calcium/sodium antiporter, partial [Bacillota bacterium]|nr:calcium/sodium antiporter [Bacillota bacterium]
LIKGADWFVSGAAGVAGWLRVPAVVIGLTIVAMGTSAPEMSVSLVGALKGQSGISVGNIIGSNLFNLLCVGGLAAIIMPMRVESILIKRDIPISLLAVILFVLFSLGGNLTRCGGISLLLLFGVFLFLLFREAGKARKVQAAPDAATLLPVWKCIIFVIIGLAGVVAGGEFVVRSATEIALNFGLSQSLVGLTIVALGTSLPEFVTTLVAAKKGENDIAMGNIIGSNIFNLALVLGAAATIRPLAVAGFVLIDTVFLAAVTVLLLFFLWKEKTLKSRHGIIFFLLYLAYLIYIINRG